MTKEQGEGFLELTTIARGAGISLIGSVVGKGLFFLYIIFLAKLLSNNDLGLYFLGLSIVFFLTIFATLGLDAGALRFIAIYNVEKDKSKMRGILLSSIGITVVSSTTIAITTFFLSDLIAVHIFHKPDLGFVIKWFSLAIPVDSILKIAVGTLQGLKQITHSVVCESVALIGTRFALTLILLYSFGGNILAVIAAHAFSSLFSLTMAYFFLMRKSSMNMGSRSIEYTTGELLRYSVPMMFSTFVFNISRQVDVLILGSLVAATQVGFYSAAARLIAVGEIVFVIFQPIFHPFIAELSEKKKFDKIASLLKTITRWNVIIGLPIFLLLLCFPDFFVQIYGKEFLVASACLSILAAANLFSPVSNLPNSVIFMSGHPEITVKNNVIALVLNAFLNYYFISRFGIIGAALATATSILSVALLRILEVYYLLRIHPFSRDFLKPYAAGAMSVAVTLLINKAFHIESSFSQVLLFLVFLVCYGFLIILFRFNKEDLYMKEVLKRKALSIIKARS